MRPSAMRVGRGGAGAVEGRALRLPRGGELTGKKRGFGLNAQTVGKGLRVLDYLRRELSEYGLEDLDGSEDDGLQEGDTLPPCLDPRCPILSEASKALGQPDVRASLSQLGGNPCSTSPLSERGRAHPLLGLRSSTCAEEGN